MSKFKCFKKRSPSLETKRTFVIVTEGEKTEPQYFGLLQKLVLKHTYIDIVAPKAGAAATDPATLLKRAKRSLQDANLHEVVHVWIVCDRDEWSSAQLDAVHAWVKESKNGNRGLAMSNPKFEYWLLLHFENGSGLKSVADCDRRLKKHLSGYHKGIPEEVVNIESIKLAIQRAKQRPCTEDSWPKNLGETTVHRLIKELLEI